MTREIEFAFWNKQKKEMWSVQSIDWNAREVCNGGDIASLGDGILLQYTGLKDKNGKKIYEGDIVSISGQGNYKVEDICKDFDMLVNAIVEGDLNKIVGNIYKNPELLKGVE